MFVRFRGDKPRGFCALVSPNAFGGRNAEPFQRSRGDESHGYSSGSSSSSRRPNSAITSSIGLGPVMSTPASLSTSIG